MKAWVERVGTELPAGRMGDERGAALILTLILIIGLVSISAGALLLTGTESQLRTYSKAQVDLRYLAEEAAEMGLSRVNRDETALPDTGYKVLEYNMAPEDAAGEANSKVKLNIYTARTGSATGTTGNFASVVGEARGWGTSSIVRLEVTEESFGKYAYFTDNEGGNIWFGGGDQIFGPVHSNDDIKIHSTGAWFHDDVTTSGTVQFPENGTFDKGYEEGVDVIPLPDASDLSKLAALAQAGHTFFTPPSTGTPDNVQMRIDFVAFDVNGDGDNLDDDEGFFRVYRSPDPIDVGSYNDGGGPTGSWREVCGDTHVHPSTGEPWFISALNHRALYENGDELEDQLGNDDLDDWEGHAPLLHNEGGGWNAVYSASVSGAGARCYLGGEPRLTVDNQTLDAWNGVATDKGFLRRADFMPGATLPAAVAARPDAEFIFPLHRDYNPDFRGVFYFDGLIGFSGVLNGRITLASSNNIVLVDDFRYTVPANTARCNDIAGFIAKNNFFIADNLLNSPQVLPSPPGTWKTFDDTRSEFIDGVILALGTSFTVENWNSGPTDAEACEATPWGRGCLYLTGGLIQEERGPVGRTNGQGYLKRYAYDSNARFCPPPHFPTTGRYVKNRYFQVSPEAFENKGTFFNDLK